MLYVMESIVLNKYEVSGGSPDSPKPVLVPGKNVRTIILYIQTCISLRFFTLTTDPVDIHTYYVVHIDGVYIVTLSWLSKLDMFTAGDCKTILNNNMKEACW